jgi:hypothetical protein
MMIRYKTILANTRLTQFPGTKELVIGNYLPKTDALYVERNKNIERTKDYDPQRSLFEF